MREDPVPALNYAFQLINGRDVCNCEQGLSGQGGLQGKTGELLESLAGRQQKLVDLSAQIVPAVVVFVANLLSGPHSSLRWEYVTALFGWTTTISMAVVRILLIVWPDSSAVGYFLQVAGFCLITALPRDYGKILRPLFPWNRHYRGHAPKLGEFSIDLQQASKWT